eukprot:scaffold59036_cov29-Prasinocladus_malaysianus.AAC.1
MTTVYVALSTTSVFPHRKHGYLLAMVAINCCYVLNKGNTLWSPQRMTSLLGVKILRSAVLAYSLGDYLSTHDIYAIRLELTNRYILLCAQAGPASFFC